MVDGHDRAGSIGRCAFCKRTIWICISCTGPCRYTTSIHRLQDATRLARRWQDSRGRGQQLIVEDYLELQHNPDCYTTRRSAPRQSKFQLKSTPFQYRTKHHCQVCNTGRSSIAIVPQSPRRQGHRRIGINHSGRCPTARSFQCVLAAIYNRCTVLHLT